MPRAAIAAARATCVWCGYRRRRFLRAGWRIRAAQGIGPGAVAQASCLCHFPRQPRRPGACAHGQERWCGWVFMVAASRGLHRTAADDGLEKSAIGEFRKPPPRLPRGTRALLRKNPAHRASPGNSPEKKSQEDDGDTACTPPHGCKVIVGIIPAGFCRREWRGCEGVAGSRSMGRLVCEEQEDGDARDEMIPQGSAAAASSTRSPCA